MPTHHPYIIGKYINITRSNKYIARNIHVLIVYIHNKAPVYTGRRCLCAHVK